MQVFMMSSTNTTCTIVVQDMLILDCKQIKSNAEYIKTLSEFSVVQQTNIAFPICHDTD